MNKIFLFLFTFAFPFLAAAIPALSQEQEEKSRVIRYVEDTLSAPNRQIRLNGLQGALSSSLSLNSITIADEEGIWLKIENPRLEWSRGALLVGRLEVESLTADRIDYFRNPEADDSAPAPESLSIEIPDLPVEVVLQKLDIKTIAFGQDVFGLESEASVAGSVRLDDGDLDLDLAIERLDGPGGSLKAITRYDSNAKAISLDVSLSEPENGIAASLLNLEGKPPVSLSIKGDAPISDLEVALAFDVDSNRILGGDMTLNRASSGYQAKVNLGGPLSSIMPATWRELLGTNSQLNATAIIPDAGGGMLEEFRLDSGEVQLFVTAMQLADGFLSALNIDFDLAASAGQRVTIPTEGSSLSLAGAKLMLRYDAARDDGWLASLNANDIQADGVSFEKFIVRSEGTVTNLQDAAQRAVTFDIKGAINGITAEDPALAEALGKSIVISGTGSWQSGQPTVLDRLAIAGETFRLATKGKLKNYVFDGRIAFDSSKLNAFSALAGRDLGGSIKVATNGTITPLTGAFDLTIDGTVNELSVDQPQTDPLLRGETTLFGGVARNENGLGFSNFKLANSQFETNINGRFSSEIADLTADALIRDLNMISKDATGPLKLDVELKGTGKPFDVTARLGLENGSLVGRRVSGLALQFDGTTDGNFVNGELDSRGTIGGETVSLAGQLAASQEIVNVRQLDVRVGNTRLAGDLERKSSSGLIDSDLTIASTDIGAIAALALIEATGALNGTVKLSTADDATQSGETNLKANGIVFGEYRAADADIEATFQDVFGTPKINADISGSGIRAGGVTVSTIEGTVANKGNATDFDLRAALEQNETKIATNGRVVQDSGATDVTLNELTLTSNIANARLASPARVTLKDGVTQVSNAFLSVGSGSIQIGGTAGERLDLDLTVSSLPLSIANAVRPDLSAGGNVSGDIRVTGTASNPNAGFQVNGNGVTIKQIADNGIAPLTLSANGQYANSAVVLESASVSNNQGLIVDASGTVPLGAGEQIDLDVSVSSLPVSLANTVRPDLGAAGTISGSAEVTGTLNHPDASFQINGKDVTVRQLSSAGVAPLTVAANGRYENDTVSLENATVRNSQGIAIDASGSIPLQGSGLNLSARGNAPLSFAEPFLASRGTNISGSVNFDVRVGGSLQNPQPTGIVTVSNGSATDPLSNLQLTGIGLMAGLNGDTVSINRAQAQLSTGGTISASGTIKITGNMAVNLTVMLTAARYTDGQTFSTVVDGKLTLTGALARDPLLAGTLNLDRTEITVPESFPSSGDLLDVRHVRPSPNVRKTLNRLERASPKGTPNARPSVIRLDITINAPNKIFVRGRGLDAELGGRVRVTGPMTNVSPIGAFQLRRGRLSILGQRIDLDEGTITLTGSLDPLLDFLARTRAGDVEAFIRLKGRTSDLEVTFSSSPELPEDEVLSRIIFGRGLSDLSPVQIARLAAVAIELTGGNSPGLVDGIRSGTGLDDLDIVQDADGGAAVRAGKYISDNVYLGIEAGQNSKATINLDITDNLKARGAAGTDGDTSIGIFYEKDY